MRVFVQNVDSSPLMPCHPARARKLLGRGRASVANMYPFTIRLREPVRDPKLQPIELGIDDGAKAVGVAAVQRRETRPDVVVFQGVVQLRNDIKGKLDTRRKMRRGRRSRKHYRPPRFDNRPRAKCKVCGGNTPDGQALCRPHAAEGHHKYAHLEKLPGWIPPSIKARKDQTLRTVRRLLQGLPISTAHLEVAFFDTHALWNPEVQGEQYQYGPMFGHRNRKAAILHLYEHKCQYCGKTDGKMEVEHIIPKGRPEGTDAINNLTCSCVECNRKKGNRTPEEAGMKLRRKPESLNHPPEVSRGRYRTLWSAAVTQSGKAYLQYELTKLIPDVRLVLGWMTNWWMKRMGLPKKQADGETKLHYTDAIAMVMRNRGSFAPSATCYAVHARQRQNRQMFDTQAYPREATLQKASSFVSDDRGVQRRLLKVTPNECAAVYVDPRGKEKIAVIANRKYPDAEATWPENVLGRYDRYDIVKCSGTLGRVSAIRTNGSLVIIPFDGGDRIGRSPRSVRIMAKRRPVLFLPLPIPEVSAEW